MKKYKKMLGDTIYRLRKEKGLSQSELGRLVGVSNKAVSKWETDEANPDINLLPLLAEAFGVTTDELLTDIKTDKNDFKPKETKILGVKGTLTDTYENLEFISAKKTPGGLPFLHIHIGKRLSSIGAQAKGIVAIGNTAKGVLAIGLISRGVVSIGLLALGVLAFGVLSLGLAAFGSLAVGGAAFGSIAVGIISFGAVSIGYMSFGALAIGHYAYTGPEGIGIGRYITITENTNRL